MLNNVKYLFKEARCSFFKPSGSNTFGRDNSYDFMDGGYLTVPYLSGASNNTSTINFQLQIPYPNTRFDNLKPNDFDDLVFEISDNSIASFESNSDFDIDNGNISGEFVIEGLNLGTTKIMAKLRNPDNSMITVGETNIRVLKQLYPSIIIHVVKDEFGHESQFYNAPGAAVSELDLCLSQFWWPSSAINRQPGPMPINNIVWPSELPDELSNDNFAELIINHGDGNYNINIFLVHKFEPDGSNELLNVQGATFFYNNTQYIIMEDTSLPYKLINHELAHAFFLSHLPVNSHFDDNVMHVHSCGQGSECATDGDKINHIQSYIANLVMNSYLDYNE